MPTYFLKKRVKDAIDAVSVCAYCGSGIELTIDHIIPRSKGGSGDLYNLTKACQRCNRYKSNFDTNTFLARMFDRRDEGINKVYGYTSRLRLHRRRKTHPELQAWLIKKIREARLNHSYYSAVIGSILRGRFKIF